MRNILIILLAALFIAKAVIAGELISVKSKDVTSMDIPIRFILEKTTWREGKVAIWGAAKNNSTGTYNFVRVIFTVRDDNGNFIGRNTCYAEPSSIGPNQVGYIEDGHVDCEGRRPSIIEFSVIGVK